MLERLFGSKIVEKICFYLLVNNKCYASELSRCFNLPIFGIQNMLTRLEQQGSLVSFKVGKTRVYQWNPRYPLLQEFKAFIAKAYEYLPQDMKEQYYERTFRTRPRKKGKPLDERSH